MKPFLRPALGAGAAGLIALVAATAPHTQRFEGTVTKAYPDVGKVWTICTGHTGPEVEEGMEKTPAECDAIFHADLIKHAQLIRRCVPETTPFDSQIAFLDFAFNLGDSNLCDTRIGASLRAGDLALACKSLNEGPDGKPRWIFVRRTRRDPNTGQPVVTFTPMNGLKARRAWERERCERGLRPQEAAPEPGNSIGDPA